MIFHQKIPVVIIKNFPEGKKEKRTYLSHGINCAQPQFVLEIIPLHQSYTVLSRSRTLQFNSTLDHVVNDTLGNWSLGGVIEEDS